MTQRQIAELDKHNYLSGGIDADRVDVHTELPISGQRLTYKFSGRVKGDAMGGDLDLGEYGSGK